MQVGLDKTIEAHSAHGRTHRFILYAISSLLSFVMFLCGKIHPLSILRENICNKKKPGNARPRIDVSKLLFFFFFKVHAPVDSESNCKIAIFDLAAVACQLIY